jgi:hypothetical protein
LQSLVLLNHPFVLHHSQRWAESLAIIDTPNPIKQPSDSVLSGPNADPQELQPAVRQVVRRAIGQAIGQAVRQAWLRPATDEELAVLSQLAHEHGLAAVCRLLINSNEFLYVE